MAPRASLACIFLLAGCFPPGEGVEISYTNVYFPVGLALDAEGRHLFVVNSDFDLQFNAGSVQSWDLDALSQVLPRTCATSVECEGIGEAECSQGFCVEPCSDGSCAMTPCRSIGRAVDEDILLYPGPCAPIVPIPLEGEYRAGFSVPGIEQERLLVRMIVSSVRIGAFATDVVMQRRPLESTGSGDRLFIPVRGDATLHWIDATAGVLDCGQAAREDGSCDAVHRSGDDPARENTRGVGRQPGERMPGEPYGVAVDDSGRAVLTTHQTSAAVGLFTNSWSLPASTDAPGRNEQDRVDYQYTLSGLPGQPIGVAALPEPLAARALGRELQPGFLVTFRDTPVVRLVRAYLDQAEGELGSSDPLRPYTKSPRQAVIQVNSSGVDSRGLAIDGSARKRAEAECEERFEGDEAGRQSCLVSAAAVPLEVYVANRAPGSLVIGETVPTIDDLPNSDVPAFRTSISLPQGPTRVVLGNVRNPDGELERRVFVICFDSRRIVVYDPERRRIETEIITGRGPQAFVVDEARGYGYVAHFTDSYVGVVDLDQRHTATYGTMIATVAEPKPPRSNQ